MNARSVCALLAVVVLGLLLMSASALSRPDMAVSDAGIRIDSGGPHKEEPDDPDPDNPGDSVTGDDDNWDRPVPLGPRAADAFGPGARDGALLGPDPAQEEPGRLEASPWIRIRVLFHTWTIIFSVR